VGAQPTVACLLCYEIRRRADTQSFFLKGTSAPDVYTLSLHDALPICAGRSGVDSGYRAQPARRRGARPAAARAGAAARAARRGRSEEHTSELQSLAYLVCRLLLEKKNVL